MEDEETIIVTMHGRSIPVPLETARSYCPREVEALEKARQSLYRDWQSGQLDLQTAKTFEQARRALVDALTQALSRQPPP